MHNRALLLLTWIGLVCSAPACRHAQPVHAAVRQADVRVMLSPDPHGNAITSLHFGANCEYHRPGLFYGTLPQNDPRCKGRDFATALDSSGIRCLRFPGGNCSYWYLFDSEEATNRLTRELKLGQFAEENFHNQFFVRASDFLSFCRMRRIEPIVQLSTLFYNDEGRPRAVMQSSYSRRAPHLYDRDRVEEAAEYAARLARLIREKRFKVKHWEMGNEEFACYSPHQYARLAVALTDAVRDRVPGAEAYVPIQQWSDKLLPLLKAGGFDASSVQLTTHYPFGNWYLPSRGIDPTDPANYLMSDMAFEKNFASARKRLVETGWAGTRIAATETSVIRFPNPNETSWDPFAIIPSFAHALAFAYNWSVLVSQPDCTSAVFHDLESTYFGIMKYDVYYDQGRKRFCWIPPDLRDRPEDVPPECWFKGRYVLTPTARAMQMLSALEGCKCANIQTQCRDADVAGRALHFAAGLGADGRCVILALNRTADCVSAEFETPGRRRKARTWHCTCLTAESLRSVLPHEVRQRRWSATTARAELPPYSLVLLESTD